MRSTSTETVHPTPPSHGHYKKPPLAGVVQSRQHLHQTSTMKFVALALALLLAVGSQAASLEADPKSQLQHARAALDVYLVQVKDSAKKAVGQLDDAEYKELKSALTLRLDDMYSQIKALQGSVSPVTDSVVDTLTAATAELRASIVADVDALKAEIEADRAKLDEVVNRHIADYHKILDPVMEDYKTRHTAEMEVMKVKLQPVVEELKAKIAVNVEETKNALQPIVESVRNKLTERLESLKGMVVPYVEEYKEQVKSAYSQAQSVNAEQLQALKGKITPLTDDIKTKLQAIFGILAETFSATE